MFPEIEIIKAGLAVTAVEAPAVEKEKLLPYNERKIAPKGFPYKEKTLIQPDDARSIWQKVKKLEELTDKKNDIMTKATAIRVQAEQKAKELQEEEGLGEIQNDLQAITDTFGAEVSEVDQELGGALMEYKNRVYGVYEVIKEGKVTDKEKLETLTTLLHASVAPEILDPIMQKLDAVIKQTEEAKKKIDKEFGSWKSPDDLRKMVKTEIPKGGAKSAGAWDAVKRFFKGALDNLLNLFAPVTEATAEAVSAIEQADPILDEAEALAGI